jgi:hypothetical protein
MQRLFFALYDATAGGRRRRGRWHELVFSNNQFFAGRELALCSEIVMHNQSYLFRNCSIGLIAAAAALLSAQPAEGQVDVGLTPMRVEFPAVPGKSFSGTLSLSNGGTAKTRVRVEMVDFFIDENMTPQFIADVPAEAEYSCQSWLTANPMEVDLEPRSQTPVRFSVHVPADATERSYHCALAFRTLAAADDTPGTAMHTAVRLISVVYATVGKPPVSGVIKDLKLEQVDGASGAAWRGVVTLENAGLMMYRPAGQLSIVDSDGKVVETQQLSSFPALPKRTQRYLLPLKNAFKPGRYTLQAHIEVGGEIQEASVVVTAEPHPPAAPLEPPH